MKSDIPHMTETDRTLRDPASYVVSVGSAHQAQDVQVSLPGNILLNFLIKLPSPGDGLQVLAVSVHGVKIHPRSVDKAARHLHLVVLKAEHHWSVAIPVLDVPVHSPVSTEQLQASLAVSSILLDSNLGDISTSAVSDSEIQTRLRNRQDDLETFSTAILYCRGQRIVASNSPDIPVNTSHSSQHGHTAWLVTNNSIE